MGPKDRHQTRHDGNNCHHLGSHPLYRADQDLNPIPNLAKSWEWSEDGTQLTMHLIEGAKWSDGAPFTADDVIFTWEDLISDPNVVRLNGIKNDAFTVDGTPATILTLRDTMCKWPIGDPADPKFAFCGRKADCGPYCTEHAAVAFQPARKREGRKSEYDYVRRIAG